MIRITADIDTTDIKVINKCINLAIKFIPNIKKLELIKSSKKGYHLIVWTTTFISKKNIFLFRELIGDDFNRIRLDKIRGRGLQTLFDRKEKISNSAVFGKILNA